MFGIRTQRTELDRDTRWKTWIRQIAKGDVDALGNFYDESSQLIFGFVLQILPDRGLAEDVLLEIYNKVRKEARAYDSQSPVDWLITIARETAVQRLRVAMPEDRVKPAMDLFKDERKRANLVLSQLPEEQRSILEMTYLGGLTVDEVADRLQVSREYVSKQILFGTRGLRMILAEFKTKPVSMQTAGYETLALIRKLHA